MTVSDFITDPEFRALCRPLSPDEFATLEASIVDEGCRDAIVVWGDIVVDGHNRLAICEKHGIEIGDPLVMDFDSRDDAKLWIINNQLGRRNLEPIDKVRLLDAKRGIFEKQARERMLAGKYPPVNLPEGTKGDVRDQLATEIGVSGKTYEALHTVVTDGAPELVDAVREKKIGASTAAELVSLSRSEQREIVARGEEYQLHHRFRSSPD